MKGKWKSLLIALGIPLTVGGAGALLSGGMSDYGAMVKPPLSPPGWVFPVVWSVLYLPIPYAYYERVKLLVAEFEGIIRDTQFGADIELELLFPEANVQPFLDKLTDMSAGTIEGMETGKEYRAFPI